MAPPTSAIYEAYPFPYQIPSDQLLDKGVWRMLLQLSMCGVWGASAFESRMAGMAAVAAMRGHGRVMRCVATLLAVPFVTLFVEPHVGASNVVTLCSIAVGDIMAKVFLSGVIAADVVTPADKAAGVAINSDAVGIVVMAVEAIVVIAIVANAVGITATVVEAKIFDTQHGGITRKEEGR